MVRKNKAITDHKSLSHRFFKKSEGDIVIASFPLSVYLSVLPSVHYAISSLTVGRNSTKFVCDRSKAVLLLWILTIPRRYFFCGSFMFLFCLVFAMSLCASVYMCFLVTCWERADLLAIVCGVYCEFVTFPLVSWVRCGT